MEGVSSRFSQKIGGPVVGAGCRLILVLLLLLVLVLVLELELVLVLVLHSLPHQNERAPFTIVLPPLSHRSCGRGGGGEGQSALR